MGREVGRDTAGPRLVVQDAQRFGQAPGIKPGGMGPRLPHAIGFRLLAAAVAQGQQVAPDVGQQALGLAPGNEDAGEPLEAVHDRRVKQRVAVDGVDQFVGQHAGQLLVVQGRHQSCRRVHKTAGKGKGGRLVGGEHGQRVGDGVPHGAGDGKQLGEHGLRPGVLHRRTVLVAGDHLLVQLASEVGFGGAAGEKQGVLPHGGGAAVGGRGRRWRGQGRGDLGCRQGQLDRRRRGVGTRHGSRTGQKQHQRQGQGQPAAHGGGLRRPHIAVHAGPFGLRPALPCGANDDNCCRGTCGGVEPASVE